MSLAHTTTELLDLRPVQLPEVVSSLERKQIAQVTIADLSKCPAYPHGLYVIFGPPPEAECYYVGAAASRSFVERVPSHFDDREHAWMNTLPKKMKKKHRGMSLSEAVDLSLQCYIMLLSMKKGKSKKKLSRLETIFRYALAPKYNAQDKRPKWLDDSKTLKQMLAEI